MAAEPPIRYSLLPKGTRRSRKIPKLRVETLTRQLSQAAATTPLLEVRDLHVQFETSRGRVRAVEGITYTVNRGEIVAVVGESGCGKSVSALAIMRLLAKTGRVTQGQILFEGQNLLDLSEEEMREKRGRDISMIFQEPMTSLNPVLSIGEQVMEPLKIHLRMTDEQATARALELLQLVGITDGPRRLDAILNNLRPLLKAMGAPEETITAVLFVGTSDVAVRGASARATRRTAAPVVELRLGLQFMKCLVSDVGLTSSGGRGRGGCPP